MSQPLGGHKTAAEALVALGSNVTSRFGTPRQVLELAIKALSANGVKVNAVSRFFSTPCFPPGAGDDFVNAAAVLETRLGPDEMLEVLHDVERRLGRERRIRWGPRTLDIDLLDYSGAVLPDAETFRRWQTLSSELQQTEAPETLILPHPRLHERAFVLVPLADIAPDWRHPILGLTTRQMLDRLPQGDKAQIRPI